MLTADWDGVESKLVIFESLVKAKSEEEEQEQEQEPSNEQ